MPSVISAAFAYLASWFKSRHAMQLEILALRHQLAVYQHGIKRPTASARRSTLVDLALTALVRLASGPGVRAAPHRHRLAEEAVPRLLATLESERQARATRDRQRSPCAHPGHVAIQPDLGFASHCRGAAQAWHQRRQIDGREVSTAGSQTGFTHVESLFDQSCQ